MATVFGNTGLLIRMDLRGITFARLGFPFIKITTVHLLMLIL